ncbi:hypothetical protein JTE90_003537 [Oedothorax gibbosus]|uniref:G-protein coupled receptors family 1 profile domain-containing protein n=1 Tax=Oedothorax gibbosus TaxID=931172 RepID=A0AAV6UQG8_9ARAC|nr:hypothetical protein JTE90_003537 [Oedothorax gibbosus]
MHLVTLVMAMYKLWYNLTRFMYISFVAQISILNSEVLDILNYGYLKPMRTAFHQLSYLNSCINPCVYGFLSDNFRNSFRTALVSLLCRKRQKVQGYRGLSRTGTTSLSYARSTYIA